MKKQYRVTLPISVVVAGVETIYRPGDIAELDDATAKGYMHALMAVQAAKESE